MSTGSAALRRERQEDAHLALLGCSRLVVTAWWLALLGNSVWAVTTPPASAQQALFLMSANPFPWGESIFPVNLYVLREGKLFTALQLLEPRGLLSLHCYHEDRICIASWFETHDRAAFLILPMERPWEHRRLQAARKEGECSVMPGETRLLQLPNAGRILSLYFYCDSEKSAYPVGLSLVDGGREELSFEEYRHVIAAGFSAPGLSFPDILRVNIDQEGRMLLGTPAGSVDLGFRLPHPVLQTAALTALTVRNDSVLAVFDPASGTPDGGEADPQEGYRYLLRRPEDQTWRTATFPGWSIREMGSWVVGYRREPARGIPSPGYEDRPKDATQTGTPFDWRVSPENAYLPGILFIYHTGRDQLYQWETGQGDSEVLLVEGDAVYYRVNRSIFRARIGARRLEDQTLLVEDDVVPDIHWAFFGPAPPDGTS